MAIQLPPRPTPWRSNYQHIVGSPEYTYNKTVQAARNAADDPENEANYLAQIPQAAPGILQQFPDIAGTAPAAAPSPAQQADPYAAFKAEFQRDYGRPITQEEMNSNQTLVKLGISNELFTKLPLDRQMAFPSDRLAALDNADFIRLVEHNPQVAGDFPTKFWQRFSNDWLAKVVGPFFQQNNPAEWTNIVNQNQIGGANAGALPAELRPPVADIRSPWGEPGTPPPQETPPGGVSGTPPAASYAGPGQFAIPRATTAQLPADIASRSALEQYYAMLGYGNVARPPAAAATAPPLLPRTAPTTPITTSTLPPPQAPPAGGGQGALGAATAAFPDFATWQMQNPGKTYNDYFAARSAVVPPSGRTGTLAGEGEYLVDENGQVVVDENGEPIPYSPGFGPGESTTPGTTPGGGGGTPTTGWTPGNPFVVPDSRWPGGVRVSDAVAARNWEQTNPAGALYVAPRVPTGRAPATPEELAQMDATRRYTETQIAALEARVKNDEAQLAEAIRARQFSEQIAIQDRLDKAKADLQNYTLQRDQLVQRQAEFGAELTQRQAEFGATATGMIGGQPTLQREVAIQQADLANKRQQADNAVNAANIALKQGDQAEAKRQFDIAQGLRGEIERGQLALSTRAQTEAERAGEFGRGLQGAQFQFQVQRDPASFVQKAYAARGVPPPAATTVPPAVAQVGAPPEAARVAGTLATTQAPLTAGEIRANVGPGLTRALGGQTPGEFFSEIPRLSAQRFNQLMPSERAEYGAAALASGTNPEDLMEEIRRRSQTGAPPPAVATRTKARPRARLF